MEESIHGEKGGSEKMRTLIRFLFCEVTFMSTPSFQQRQRPQERSRTGTTMAKGMPREEVISSILVSRRKMQSGLFKRIKARRERCAAGRAKPRQFHEMINIGELGAWFDPPPQSLCLD
jgi:hypothetical protein